jgi:hypothetical protein
VKEELTEKVIKDDLGVEHTVYDLKICGRVFSELPDKEKVLKFIKLLKSCPEPEENIEIVLDDYLLS